MATTAQRIARYAYDFPEQGLPPEVTACVRARFLDSLACILGAYGSNPVKAAVAHAATVPVAQSTVFGTQLKTTADIAAFANGVMVRFLDYNDGYMGAEPGHPSDSIPACLAVAESEGATGQALISAIALAYEIQMRLQDAASLHSRGWDHVNYLNISVAAAAGKLMRLNPHQIEQAINMAVSAHVAMRQVRSGALSDWKGCSAANAARNAIFAAQLARRGLTGPSPVFEGDLGFFKQISGEFALDVDTFGNLENRDFMILRSLTKTFPANGELHTAISAALSLRTRLQDIDEVEAVHIETSAFSKRVLADTPDKWRPKTRETADHSLPYTVARALLDGDIDLRSYSAEKISDPAAIALMDKTRVSEDSALTKLFPKQLANRVTIILAGGEELVSEVVTGPGSVETPMTQADFENKFRRMASPHIDLAAQNAILAFVAELEQVDGYESLFSSMSNSSQAY